MFNFQRKNTEFFDHFVESAKCFYRGSLILDEVMLDYTADAVNDQIIDELNQTFITPIDREDIFALANGLDDGVDFLQTTLQRIVIYRTGAAKAGVVSTTKLLLPFAMISMSSSATLRLHLWLFCNFGKLKKGAPMVSLKCSAKVVLPLIGAPKTRIA